MKDYENKRKNYLLIDINKTAEPITEIDIEGTQKQLEMLYYLSQVQTQLTEKVMNKYDIVKRSVEASLESEDVDDTMAEDVLLTLKEIL